MKTQTLDTLGATGTKTIVTGVSMTDKVPDGIAAISAVEHWFTLDVGITPWW